MSFLLMVFLTLVCLFDAYPPSIWQGSPVESFFGTAALLVLVALSAWCISWRIAGTLARDPSRRDVLLGWYERARSYHHLLLLTLYVVALVLFGWGWAVRQTWRWHGQELFGLELALLSPFLLGQVISWLFFYDADRAVQQATHRLLQGEPFAAHWLESRSAAPFAHSGRLSYVLFQLRQKLALVFIPVLLMILQKELFRLLPQAPTSQWVIQTVGFMSLATVFVCMPLLVRLVLGLRPLPTGPIRDRLEQGVKRLGIRCSQLLLWSTRNGVANAMVIGLVPWLRYVVFTDRMLEEFTEEEVEAVLGHEIGHLRHQHMLYYLAVLVLSMWVLGLFAEQSVLPWLAVFGNQLAVWLPSWLPAHFGDLLAPGGSLAVFPVVGLLLLYIFVVFGFLSRRCERQADVFGCRAVSCLDRHCTAHTPDTPLPSRGLGLCPTGIRTFIRALEKVALINGISRDRPGFLQSWQHSSIARRVAFLQQLLTDEDAEPLFQRQLFALKMGTLLVLVTLLIVLVVIGS